MVKRKTAPKAATQEAPLAARQMMQQKKMRYRVSWIIGIMLAVMVVGLVVAFLYDRAIDGGASLRRQTAMQSEHFKIDGCMMRYCFSRYYANLQSSYGDAFQEKTGIDPEKPLRSQTVNGTNAVDILLSGLQSELQQTLLLAEGAYAAGIFVPEESKTTIATMAQAATGLPQGVRAEDVSNVMQLNYMAQRYAETVQYPTFSDEQIETYATSDLRSGAYMADIYAYAFFYTAGNAQSVANAKALAQELAAVPQEKTFREHLITMIEKANGVASTAAAAQADTALFTGVTDDGASLGEWLFTPERAAKDTIWMEDQANSAFRVYAVQKAPYLPQDATVTLHEIVFPLSVFRTEQICLEKAQALQKTYQADPGYENFLALAQQNNFSGAEADGLRSDVPRASLWEQTAAFAFAEERQPGDTAILQNDEAGVSLVYYIGAGKPYYFALARQAMQNESYAQTLTALAQAYPISSDAAVLASAAAQ
ncbi:MAG: hypothetical protein SOV91_08090 [Eubacteriales bacterium]|nr:hypothetical protein [Eubacteriales bacterium]